MILAVTTWSWLWLALGGGVAALETAALVKDSRGTLSQNLQRVTLGPRKWIALGAWVVFAIWFPIHLWAGTQPSSVRSFRPPVHQPTTAPASTTTFVPASACREGIRPDPACTPGALNPNVTQATIHQTICVVGWTSTIRPPVSVTGPIKLERMRAYGIGGQSPTVAELDHFVPLELGGATVDIRNLWPELYAGTQGARTKDGVENLLKTRVCSGALTLAVAQTEIETDWTKVR